MLLKYQTSLCTAICDSLVTCTTGRCDTGILSFVAKAARLPPVQPRAVGEGSKQQQGPCFPVSMERKRRKWDVAAPAAAGAAGAATLPGRAGIGTGATVPAQYAGFVTGQVSHRLEPLVVVLQ
jgi:hypothetical protein